MLTAGPPGAPPLVLVHGNVSSARFFAETMAALGGTSAASPPTCGASAGPSGRRWTRGAASATSPTTCTPCSPRPACCPAAAGAPARLVPGRGRGAPVRDRPPGRGRRPWSWRAPCRRSVSGAPGTRPAPPAGRTTPDRAAAPPVPRWSAGSRPVTAARRPASPRQVLTHLYGNPRRAPACVEDALVEAMLEMAIGPATTRATRRSRRTGPAPRPGDQASTTPSPRSTATCPASRRPRTGPRCCGSAATRT